MLELGKDFDQLVFQWNELNIKEMATLKQEVSEQLVTLGPVSIIQESDNTLGIFMHFITLVRHSLSFFQLHVAYNSIATYILLRD